MGENQEIEREEREEDAEMTKLICENNLIKNVQDDPSEKIGIETTESMKAGDIVIATSTEILIDSKLKEGDDGAPHVNGKEETSKSKNKDIAQQSSDADTNPIKRLEDTNN